jgi:DNA-binding transcriptional LysR family regulator
MIDVDDLRAFQQVAALLNFSAAGRALSVRKSAISRSIQRLEDVFRVRLFERTTREVALTDGGRMLLDRFHEIVARVDEAVELAASLSTRPAGRIKVSAGIGFGMEVLTELLPAFALAYPEVVVTLDLTSRTVDLVAEQVDAAFRMGPMVDSSLIAVRLGSLGCLLCAAPSYLARCGVPQTVEELRSHSLLAIPRGDNLPRRWSLNDKDGQVHEFDAPMRLSANDPKALHNMVLHGAGITASANYMALPEIERGALVRVLPDWTVPSVDVSLVMSASRERSPAVRAFADFIKRKTARNRRWFDS